MIKSSDNSAEFWNDKKSLSKFQKGFYNYNHLIPGLEHSQCHTSKQMLREQVDYKVKTYLPDYAVVYVRPETATWITNVHELSRKFWESKGKYSSYSEAIAGEKYILEK